MSYRKLFQNQNHLLLIAATVCTLGVTACGTAENTVASKQGTIPLDAVKVGMPTSVIQDAMMTFAEDPKGAVGNKTQFLSRMNDSEGGQYVLQCSNGKIYETQVYYVNTPITKDQALQKFKALFPADLPAEVKVDNSGLSKPALNELHYFGNNYVGELVYTDNTGTRVKMVNAWVQSSPAS